MESKRHLNHVESLRAFAALSVAIFHFSAYFTWNEQTTINFSIGAQGVEIFYIISGFIIPYSLYHTRYVIRNYFKYMGKRLVRLLPPYITTIVLIQLLGIVFCHFLWGCQYDINFRQIATNVFFVADLFPDFGWINPIFATLEVELQFYIVVGLLFPLFTKNKWFFPAICILLLMLGLLTRHMDTFLVNSPYFICGMSVFFISEKGYKIPYLIPLIAVSTALLIHYMWQDVAAFLVGGLLLLFLPSNFRFLNFTGRISYSFYLVHGLSGGWFLYFYSTSDFATKNPLVMMVAAILFSWIVAFIIYRLVEKPFMRISKKIRYEK